MLHVMMCSCCCILCRRRGKTERESESRISQDNEGPIVSDGSKIKLPGQLEFDQGLWEHIQQISNTIKPLPSTIQQLQEIAKQVYHVKILLLLTILTRQVCF